MSVPRWSVYVVAAALIASLSFSFGSLYSAFGTSHDTTYHACLFAGSLSQVSETPPVNCGRGTPISWHSEGGPAGPSGTSHAITYSPSLSENVPAGNFGTVSQFELPAGTYVVSASVQVFNPEVIGTAINCRLLSGSQTSAIFTTDAIFLDALPLQAAFVLDNAADIELQCRFSPGTSGGHLITGADFIAIQIDTVTVIPYP